MFALLFYGLTVSAFLNNKQYGLVSLVIGKPGGQEFRYEIYPAVLSTSTILNIVMSEITI